MVTPLRRLDGVSYWVIDEADGIYDFINTEVRKEWEEDIKNMPGDPASGVWLQTLPKRKWRLDIVNASSIGFDQSVMGYFDAKSGYNFAEHLTKRSLKLREALERWARVIWPVVVREEDMQVLDGYCRFTALKEIGVSRLYAYLGSL